ncbi:MAG: RNA 3'-terminal phosphate cyclase [Halobacteriales archaeon]
MIEIDGSAGGGQILRSALTLSAITDEAVTIKSIRGDRPNPGLRPQHLTAVEVMADICDAEVEDATEGSESITFRPEALSGGRYTASIGTAGSVTLLFDCVLPLAWALSTPLTLTATGGTDVKWSPPLGYFRHVKLPVLMDAGLVGGVVRERTGFYPAGGGTAVLQLAPTSTTHIAAINRGELRGARIFSRAADTLTDASVAERQADTAVDHLATDDIPILERTVTYEATPSPGSVLLVTLEYERTRAGFDALGERGKPAEDVANDATDMIETFRAGRGAVDVHLADQLLVPLAIAGGRLAIPRVTDHVETSLDLLAEFDFDIKIERSFGDSPIVSAAPAEYIV